MSAIDGYVQQIETAVYGKHVRSAIANGIKECYHDVQQGVTIAEGLVAGATATGTAGASAAANVSVVETEGERHLHFAFTLPKGDKGDKGNKGDTGSQGPQGVQGVKGDKGDPFTVKKTFTSVAAMEAYTGTDLAEGDFVMIAVPEESGGTEAEDNAKLYVKSATGYTFISDLSGSQGMKGEKGDTGAVPQFSIGTVTTLNPGQNATASIGGTATNPVLNLGLPRGAIDTEVIDDTKGIGDTGNVWSADKSSQELNKKANVEDISRSKTRIGNPIQIEDAVNEIADKTVIKLVPKQDLHGFSKPWVGGAGKNLLDSSTFNSSNSGFTKSGEQFTNTATDNRTKFYLNVIAGSTTLVPSTNPIDNTGIYCTESFTLSADTSDFKIKHNGGTSDIWIRFTQTVKAGTYKFVVNVVSNDPTTAGGLVIKDLMLIASTEINTTFAPYSNICPITGYDMVNVVRSGKNKIIKTFVGYNVESNGKFVGGSTFSAHVAQVEKGKTYIISGNTDSPNGVVYSFFYAEPTTASVSYNNSRIAQASPKYFTAPITGYVAVRSYKADANVQVEEGTVATSYKAPSGAVYPIAVSLATNGNQTAGTVYSGTVTLLADGSGQLVVDRKVWGMDSFGSMVVDEVNGFGIRTTTPGRREGNTTYDTCCSHFSYEGVGNTSYLRTIPNGSYAIQATTTWIYFMDTDLADNTLYPTAEDKIAAFRAKYADIQVSINLATPLTYTLTANQVQTLLGYNYIYTDGAEIALTYRQESLATNETLLKLLPTGTATGNPVTFSDGADGVPLKQLVVNVEPNQDLHGYENPWVAGAGKNKLNDNVLKRGYYIKTSSGVEYAANNNFISYEVNLPAGTYTFSTNLSNCYIIRYIVGNEQTNVGQAAQKVTFTTSATADVKMVVRNTSTSDISSITPHSMIESGSTDTAYAPYENICPIWGWDSVPLLRTGKNLYDWKANIYTQNKEIFLPEGNYVLSCKTYSGTHTWYISGLKLNGEWCTKEELGVDAFSKSSATYADIYYGLISVNGLPFSSPVGGAKFKFGIADTDGTVPTQIEIGSTATAYEDPIAKTYDISIPSEAGTVYGCQIVLDENGEGTLTVTHGIVDLGSLTYTYDSQYSRFISTSDLPVTITTRTLKCICSAYRCIYSGQDISSIVNGDFYLSAKKVVIHDNSTTDASAFKTSVAGQMMVYPLATPITYSLTADQVKTLLGTNIISSDAGNVEVEYFQKLSGKGTGEYSHVEGRSTIASGLASHAEGDATEATGASAHSEGYSTHATGNNSHAEGMNSTASGEDAHAEGFLTTASGDFSHVEGSTATASGQSSHAEGKGTTANHLAQHVFGIFNAADPSTAAATAKGNYVEIVGNGTSVSAKHNARTLDWNGNEWVAGKLTMGASPTNDMDAIPLGLLPTGSATGNPITLMDGSKDLALKQLKIKIEPKQEGSGTPSPTNIRPISGYNSINIIRTGRNLIDNKAVSGTVNNVTVIVNDDGTVALNGTANGDGSITLATGISIKSGYDYTLTGCPSGGVRNSTYWLNYFGDGVNEDGYDVFVMTDAEEGIDGGIDSTYDQIGSASIKFKNGTVFNNVVFSPMIYREDLSKVYERGDTKTYTVSLPSAAGTVYSGEVTIFADGSGQVYVDRVCKTMDNFTWYLDSDNSPGRFLASITGMKPCASSVIGFTDTGIICSHYQYSALSKDGMPDGSIRYNEQNKILLFVKDSRYATAQEFTTAASGMSLCYPLATPVTYTLTTEQVKTILGINIISSDAGSMDAVYCRALVGSPDLSNYVTEPKVDRKIASGIDEDGLLVLDLGTLHGQSVATAEPGGIKYGRYKAIAIEVGRPDYFDGDVTVTTNNYSFNVAYRLKSSGNVSTMKIILRKVYKVRTFTNLGTSSVTYTDNDLPLTNTTVFKVGS